MQALGHWLSALPLQTRAVSKQRKVQLPTAPVRTRVKSRLSTHRFDCVWQVATGSQVSPASSTPLPQTRMQLLSLLALQPEGQQPSPLVQVDTVPPFTHSRVQAEPRNMRS